MDTQKMKKRWLLAAICLASGFSVVRAQGAEPLGLRAAHIFDDKHPWQKGLKKFSELVETRSNGTLTVKIFDNAILGSERSYFSRLLLGDLDLAVVSTGSAGDLAEVLNFLDTMFLWKDRAQWQRALDGEIGQRIAAAIEKGTAKGGNPGLKALGYWGGSPRHLMGSKRGFTSLEQMRGLRLRVQASPVQEELWARLGVTPIVIPLAETARALRAQRVEALDQEMANAFALGLHKVAPHVTETGHTWTVRPLLMSGHTWKKLTPEQQEIVVAAAKEASRVARQAEWKQNDEATVQMKAEGVEFYPFPAEERKAMRELTEGIRRRVAERLGVGDILTAIKTDAEE